MLTAQITNTEFLFPLSLNVFLHFSRICPSNSRGNVSPPPLHSPCEGSFTESHVKTSFFCTRTSGYSQAEVLLILHANMLAHSSRIFPFACSWRSVTQARELYGNFRWHVFLKGNFDKCCIILFLFSYWLLYRTIYLWISILHILFCKIT